MNFVLAYFIVFCFMQRILDSTPRQKVSLCCLVYENGCSRTYSGLESVTQLFDKLVLIVRSMQPSLLRSYKQVIYDVKHRSAMLEKLRKMHIILVRLLLVAVVLVLLSRDTKPVDKNPCWKEFS